MVKPTELIVFPAVRIKVSVGIPQVCLCVFLITVFSPCCCHLLDCGRASLAWRLTFLNEVVVLEEGNLSVQVFFATEHGFADIQESYESSFFSSIFFVFPNHRGHFTVTMLKFSLVRLIRSSRFIPILSRGTMQSIRHRTRVIFSQHVGI